MSDITHILSQIESGNRLAAEQLLPLVYEELRKLAAARLLQEKPGQTLQATSLVHEAYLRLVGSHKDQHWASRGHFFSAAAEAMRRILVENARRKKRHKHGGGHVRLELDDVSVAVETPPDELLALDEAMTKLASLEPQKAEVVKLHYFAGLSLEDTAEVLGISRTTVKRHWAYARAWLFAEIHGSEESENS